MTFCKMSRALFVQPNGCQRQAFGHQGREGSVFSEGFDHRKYSLAGVRLLQSQRFDRRCIGAHGAHMTLTIEQDVARRMEGNLVSKARKVPKGWPGSAYNIQ